MGPFLNAFVFGMVGAAGATIGRKGTERFVFPSAKTMAYMRENNPYYSPVVYPPTAVACPCCGAAFLLERVNGNRARVASIREPNPEVVSGREAHVGIREDLERRRRTDRGAVIRSQAPQEGGLR